MKALLLITLLSLPALAEENKNEKKSYLQIREDRIGFFIENQTEKTKDYDDQELDLLYMDLPKLTILELYRKYPEFTPKELEDLKTKRK